MRFVIGIELVVLARGADSVTFQEFGVYTWGGGDFTVNFCVCNAFLRRLAYFLVV